MTEKSDKKVRERERERDFYFYKIYIINSSPIDFKGVFDTDPGLVISYPLVMLLSCSHYAAFMLL